MRHRSLLLSAAFFAGVFLVCLSLSGKDELPSVSIKGSGNVNAGEYNEVTISGSGDIKGDIKAKIIRIYGSCDADGNVKAEELKVSGSFDVEGSVWARKLNADGSMSVSGDLLETEEGSAGGSLKSAGKLKAGKFKSTGSVNVAGISGGEYRSYGSLKVSEDIKVDRFYSYGSFEVGQNISSDYVEIRLGGDCVAQEIKGKSIDVRLGRGQFVIDWLKQRKLGVEKIEGDDIYIEKTTAKLVKGRSVKIGPECNIEKVVYTEHLEVDAGSNIEKSIKK